MASTEQLKLSTLLGQFAERKARIAAEQTALDIIGAEIARRAAVEFGGAMEGTQSGEAGEFKYAVTFKLNRKLDADAIKRDYGKLPSAVVDALKWTAELQLPKFRALDAANAAVMQEYIAETKPAKPSVVVTPLVKAA